MNIKDEYDEFEKDLNEARKILKSKGENMNVHQIVEKYLTDNGYDGLCLPEQECGCHISDLFPCGSDPSQCQPGHRAAAEGGWIIIPGKDG
jgi:hypothetical protein